jgi:hypothetical protein
MQQMNSDAFITRSQAAMLTGVSADAIGKWHARGWRSTEGELRHLRTRSGSGRTLLYRLGDIIDAERETRNNPNSRRPVLDLFVAA